MRLSQILIDHPFDSFILLIRSPHFATSIFLPDFIDPIHPLWVLLIAIDSQLIIGKTVVAFELSLIIRLHIG